jgi:hypothetical protein
MWLQEYTFGKCEGSVVRLPTLVEMPMDDEGKAVDGGRFMKTTIIFVIKAPVNQLTGRPQRPRSLRHEMSSLARTLGSWVRIPLEAWMSVCVYSVFMLGSGLATC